MKKGFWKKLNRGFLALAPMADVTDTAFRELIAKYSRPSGPDVFWTEFVSADGLAHPEAREKLKRDLEYTEEERPIVAQIFSSNEENMESAARFVAQLGFDGIDINMGCPDRSIEKQGCGAAHIKDMDHAQKIIRATQKGAGDVPVSVKTRIGYNKEQIDEWIPRLLETGIAALTIHARTRKEMSKVPARWEEVKRVVDIRDKMGVDTLIIGNGDVTDIKDAEQKIKESGADGAMLGRAIFGNPWLFNHKIDGRATSVKEKLHVMVEHTKLFEKKLGDIKNFAIMKKHYKAYVTGFDGAKELRMELMEAEDSGEVEKIVEQYINGIKK